MKIALIVNQKSLKLGGTAIAIAPMWEMAFFIELEAIMSANGNIPYEESDLYRIRHSAAHVMAEAVLGLFPEAKLAIGPPIEDGFYYDFDLGLGENGKPITFTPEDLEQIEQNMKLLLKKNARFEHSTMSVDEAQDIFRGSALQIGVN